MSHVPAASALHPRPMRLTCAEFRRGLLRSTLIGPHWAAIVELGTTEEASIRSRSIELALAFGGCNLSLAPGGTATETFEVTPRPWPPGGGFYSGNGRRSERLALHTDASGVRTGAALLVLGCARAAALGGETLLADGAAVWRGLSPACRAELMRPVFREDPYSGRVLVTRPLVDAEGRWSYHPDRVRVGCAAKGMLDPSLSAALDELDATLESSAIEILLSAGEALILDNTRVLHGRRAFSSPADQAPRLLFRVWADKG